MSTNLINFQGAWSSGTQYNLVVDQSHPNQLIVPQVIDSGVVYTAIATPTLGTHPASDTGKWQVVGSSSGITESKISFTPVLTCTTPGDLSITYSSQFGSGSIVGNNAIVQIVITTSAFTWTTATGQLQITGLPAGLVPVLPNGLQSTASLDHNLLTTGGGGLQVGLWALPTLNYIPFFQTSITGFQSGTITNLTSTTRNVFISATLCYPIA